MFWKGPYGKGEETGCSHEMRAPILLQRRQVLQQIPGFRDFLGLSQDGEGASHTGRERGGVLSRW